MRKNYLGIKLTHDAAVALIADGRLEFSIELEKINENPRYSKCQSVEEIEDILHSERVNVDDCEIAIDGWTHGFLKVGEQGLRVAPYHDGDAISSEQHCWGWQTMPVPIMLQGRGRQAYSFTHVESHILGAYAMSPWSKDKLECNVLVWDGGVNPRLYSVCPRLEKNPVVCIGHLHQLYGMMYGVMGYYWGPFKDLTIFARDPTREQLWGRRDWPGKLMAYIAYGTANADLMSELNRNYIYLVNKSERKRMPSGHYQDAVLEHQLCRSVMTNNHLRGLKDEDVLASIHEWLTLMLISGVKRNTQYGERLIFTGGSALNIKWNSALRNCEHIWELFVPPCANDSGNAIGAACALASRSDQWHLEWSPYSGPKFHAGFSHVDRWTKVVCNAKALASIIADSYLPVLCMQGRAEIGPRALGARSILMNPAVNGAKDLLNKIKGREYWRPVAPMVLDSQKTKWFGSGGTDDYYMLFDHVAKDCTVEAAPSVVHLDGTARVQVIKDLGRGVGDTATEGPEFLSCLLRNFMSMTGLPFMCNTSANRNGCGFFPTLYSAMNWAEEVGIKHIYADGNLYERA